MVKINSAVEVSIDALIAYLQPRLSVLSPIIDEFPDASTDMELPALTISHTGTDGSFSALQPTVLAHSIPDVNNKTQVQYLVGMWDFPLQLDFWARSVPERDQLFSDFFLAFNQKINPMGLSLQAAQYYNQWVRYDISGFKHFDNGESSQRGIWRTMVNLLVNMNAILEGPEYAIKTIVNEPALFNTNEDFPIP